MRSSLEADDAAPTGGLFKFLGTAKGQALNKNNLIMKPARKRGAIEDKVLPGLKPERKQSSIR